jgi:hypothetical protein
MPHPPATYVCRALSLSNAFGALRGFVGADVCEPTPSAIGAASAAPPEPTDLQPKPQEPTTEAKLSKSQKKKMKIKAIKQKQAQSTEAQIAALLGTDEAAVHALLRSFDVFIMYVRHPSCAALRFKPSATVDVFREKFVGKEVDGAVVVGCVSLRMRPIERATNTSLEVDVSPVVVEDGCGDAQFVVCQLIRATETVLRGAVTAVLSSAQAPTAINGLYLFAAVRPEHAGKCRRRARAMSFTF